MSVWRCKEKICCTLTTVVSPICIYTYTVYACIQILIFFMYSIILYDIRGCLDWVRSSALTVMTNVLIGAVAYSYHTAKEPSGLAGPTILAWAAGSL